MKGIRPLEVVALLAIILNLVGLVVWGLVRPTARYEQAAYDRLNKGKTAYQRGDFEIAFAYYDDVARNFPRSNHANRALFLAGRTAFRALGRVDVAIDRLEEYERRYPRGEYLDASKRYLKLVAGFDAMDPKLRDTAVWEFIQAGHDEEHGRYFEAMNRYQFILDNCHGTGVHEAAAKAKAAILEAADRAYRAMGRGEFEDAGDVPAGI